MEKNYITKFENLKFENTIYNSFEIEENEKNDTHKVFYIFFQ